MGLFINAAISFLAVSVALFFLVKALNRLRRQEQAAPAPPPGLATRCGSWVRSATCCGGERRTVLEPAPRAPATRSRRPNLTHSGRGDDITPRTAF